MRIFRAAGARAALIVLEDDDEADVVLESLMQLSVRYHPLAATKPAIVDSMRVLAGRLDAATIAAAAAANPAAPEPAPGHLLAACVHYAAVAQVYWQRESLWLAVEILHIHPTKVPLPALRLSYPGAWAASPRCWPPCW